MPRYFFHIEGRDLRFNDPDGHELITLNAAHEHALRLIDKTTKFVCLPRGVRWVVNVCDTTGQTVLIVLFPVYSPGWFGSVLNGQSSLGLIRCAATASSQAAGLSPHGNSSTGLTF